MNSLAASTPYLATAAVVLCLVGLRMLVTDPLTRIEAEDLRVINQRGRRRLQGQSDPKMLLGAVVGRPLRRLAGDPGRRLVQRRIDQAGGYDGKSVDYFFHETGYWALILGAVALTGWVGGLPAWVCLLVALFGLGAPLYQLWATGAERQATIDQDLPDFLDVLAVVVSAGLGFQQAVNRVANRYGGPLGEEMQRALDELNVGESLRTSLTGVRDRTSSDSVDQFVTALVQSDELGSPLAESLNQIAVDVRREAAELAKRQAAKAAPKATVITIAFFMPPTMAIMVYGMIVALR